MHVVSSFIRAHAKEPQLEGQPCPPNSCVSSSAAVGAPGGAHVNMVSSPPMGVPAPRSMANAALGPAGTGTFSSEHEP